MTEPWQEPTSPTTASEAAGKMQEKTRNYQREMYEESLHRNIIVTMDTGSGKTHVAILRILAELEKGDGKLCWFLVPKVALGEQQFEVLKRSLPPVNMQFLTGSRGVDKWSNQEIWDAVLGDREGVIVSTHQVLLDALSHGFVGMERLGLIVYDEAHYCVEQHPSNLIMKDFYHPRMAVGIHVPAILGLTASPLFRANPRSLEIIEANLNAIARTPTIYRDELIAHVHLPKLKSALYGETPRDVEVTDFEQKTITATNTGATWADFLLPEVPLDEGLSSSLSAVFGVSKDVVGSEKVEDEDGFERLEPPPHVPTDTIGQTTFSVDNGLLNDMYEHIDPETGDIITPGQSAAPRQTNAAPHVVSNAVPGVEEDEYEEIDPETGSPILKASLSSAIPSRQDKNIPGLYPHLPAPAVSFHHSSSPNMHDRGRTPLATLVRAYGNMNILEDPYVMLEKKRGASYLELDNLITKKNTYCQQEMKGLVNKAKYVLEEFGEWATDWFICEAVRRFFKSQKLEDLEDGEIVTDELMDWTSEEFRYLRSVLADVHGMQVVGSPAGRISSKVEKLIEILCDEYAFEKAEFSGLVFVEQRAGCSVLASLLEHHPATRFLKIGTMVGSSQGYHKTAKVIQSLLGKASPSTLDDFRSGKKNLIVATTVIEEGLDVQDCHLVVCFQPPPNLKSFVQRRGRARRANSSYIIMYPANVGDDELQEFERMEKEMVALYQDETREQIIAQAEEEESYVEDESDKKIFKVKPTGALLTVTSAIPHLMHFCACLPSQEFFDTRPEFRVEGGLGMYSCEVILPNAIAPEIRRTQDDLPRKTEHWAKRHAAFKTCVKLYEKKLLNDNLMPLVKAELQSSDDAQRRPPKASVPRRLDPWSSVDPNWWDGLVYHAMVEVKFPIQTPMCVGFLSPYPIPEVDEFDLYWTNDEVARVTIGSSSVWTGGSVEASAKATYRLFDDMFSGRMKENAVDFPYAFVMPSDATQWLSPSKHKINALDAYKQRKNIVGTVTENQAKFQFVSWRKDIEPLDNDKMVDHYGLRLEISEPGQPVLECMTLPKRRDFLHPEVNGAKKRVPKTFFLLPEYAEINSIPWTYTQLSLFLPAIIDRVEKSLVAADLQATFLTAAVPELSTPMVLEAISASSAIDPTDYQRLEFLGDSVLKFLTSIAVMDEHPLYHEGYLAGAKDKIVSNTKASEVAIERELSKWIVTENFTGLKWRPRYTSEPIVAEKPRQLSTKVLADVVESLIGASYLTDGFTGSTACLKCFNWGIDFLPLQTRISNLVDKSNAKLASYSNAYPKKMADLESLIGYKFKNRTLLLEAITHLSCDYDLVSMSYQRLEFLGDAVLDMVVVDELYHSSIGILSHIQMHHLRSAVVNAHFLAYLCMGFSIQIPIADTVNRKSGNSWEPSVQNKMTPVPLYRFLRASETMVAREDARAYDRWQRLKPRIEGDLEHAPNYPWTELTEVGAPKHMSDIVESIIAALWIDCGGCFRTVRKFLYKIGLLGILERLVRDRVEADHPSSLFGKKVANSGRLGTTKYVVEDGDGGYWCELSADGEVVSRVDQCTSRAHARTKAARDGLRILAMREEREREEARARSRWENKDEVVLTQCDEYEEGEDEMDVCEESPKADEREETSDGDRYRDGNKLELPGLEVSESLFPSFENVDGGVMLDTPVSSTEEEDAFYDAPETAP